MVVYGVSIMKNNAFSLAQKLVAVTPDEDTRTLAMMLLMRLRLPMTKVLEKVPGDTIADKARAVDVERSVIYGWMDGRTRPRRNEAMKLAEITGYKIHEITGRPEA